MRCREVQTLLVPFEEEQLAPGRAEQVASHVDQCEACGRELSRLSSVRISRPTIPAPVLATQFEHLDAIVELELSREAPLVDTRDLGERIGDWLHQESHIPNAWLLAYAALGMAVLGWGLWALSGSPEQVELSQPMAVDMQEEMPQRVDGVPSEQYVPASYTPERDVF